MNKLIRVTIELPDSENGDNFYVELIKSRIRHIRKSVRKSRFDLVIMNVDELSMNELSRLFKKFLSQEASRELDSSYNDSQDFYIDLSRWEE